MKRYITAILLLIAVCGISSARNRRNDFFTRVHYGVEWGYSQHFYISHNFNYINSEGNRIPGGREGFDWSPAGNVLVEIGYDVSKHLSLELATCFIGASDKDRYLPVMMCVDYFYQGYMNRGTFSFAKAGTGLREPFGSVNRMAVLGAIGQGYRLPLAAGINLDLKMSLQFTFDSPPIKDPNGSGNIPERNIRKNNARYYALNISVGLNF